MLQYKTDPSREKEYCDDKTGIYVRALDSENRWTNVDIAWLDRESLVSWLRSRGGQNDWAEAVVLILLGHKPE